jgi:hypothetical protein
MILAVLGHLIDFLAERFANSGRASFDVLSSVGANHRHDLHRMATHGVLKARADAPLP